MEGEEPKLPDVRSIAWLGLCSRIATEPPIRNIASRGHKQSPWNVDQKLGSERGRLWLRDEENENQCDNDADRNTNDDGGSKEVTEARKPKSRKKPDRGKTDDGRGDNDRTSERKENCREHDQLVEQRVAWPRQTAVDAHRAYEKQQTRPPCATD
ncbi:MAG: hypothetical protein QOK24_1214 [Verrucomicrobiota bacterium]